MEEGDEEEERREKIGIVKGVSEGESKRDEIRVGGVGGDGCDTRHTTHT
jgi:hypothetical protein